MDDEGVFPIGFDAALAVFNVEFYVANLELAGLSLADRDDDGDVDGDDAVLDYFGEGDGLALGRIASPIQARTFVDGAERSVFDEDFYLSNIPAAERARIEAGEFASALDHYILVGAFLDSPNETDGPQFDPNEFFDSAAYAAANPDVGAAGINAFFHFLQFGEPEAVGDALVLGDGQTNRIAGVSGVDLEVYAAENDDVRTLIVEPGASTFFQHFLQFGRFEGRAGVTGADDFGNTPATAGAITVGATQIGSLEEAGDDDWFAVTLEAGVTYDITLRGTFQGPNGSELTDPVLRVFGPDGTSLLAFNDDDPSSLDSALSFTPEESGTHFLSARAFADEEAGDYALAIALGTPAPAGDVGNTPATAAAITVGASRTDTLETVGDEDWFAVTLEAGVAYEIRLAGAGGVDGLDDPVLRVFDTDGAGLVAFNEDADDTTFDAALVFVPEMSGTYFVSAREFANEARGDYTVSVELEASGAFDAPIFGDGFGNDLDGGNGRDAVFGRGGDDDIEGGSGDDQLFGGAGADVIEGEEGADSVRLGPGADVYVVDDEDDISIASDAFDVILDFRSGEDRIDLSGLDLERGVAILEIFDTPFEDDPNFFGGASVLVVLDPGRELAVVVVDADGDGALDLDDDGGFLVLFDDPDVLSVTESDFIL